MIHARRALCCGLLLSLLLVLPGCVGRAAPGIPLVCQQSTTLTPACFDAYYSRYSPLLQASTHLAVGFYLQEHPSRTQPMHAVLTRVQARLAHNELTTLMQLEGVVMDHVQWQTLEPATTQGVKLLITAVRVALEGFLADANVHEPAQVRVVAKDVVDWAQQAVTVACATCTQAAARELR